MEDDGAAIIAAVDQLSAYAADEVGIPVAIYHRAVNRGVPRLLAAWLAGAWWWWHRQSSEYPAGAPE